MTRCRHSKWWNIGGLHVWCPDCGAIRKLKTDIFDTSSSCQFAWPRWLKANGAQEAYDAWEKMTRKDR